MNQSLAHCGSVRKREPLGDGFIARIPRFETDAFCMPWGVSQSHYLPESAARYEYFTRVNVSPGKREHELDLISRINARFWR
jgi:hypothetical protein